MFTTYSLIMAQVEFGIVGKNVVESELKLQFLMYYKFLVQFLTYYNFLQNGGNSILFFCLLFSILTHTDYSQNYSGIIHARFNLPSYGRTCISDNGYNSHLFIVIMHYSLRAR